VTTKCNQIPLGNQPHNCGVEHQTFCCNQSQKKGRDGLQNTQLLLKIM